MTKKAEITPLPWTEDRFGSLKGSNGEHIIVWGLGIGWGSRNDTTEANAAYIVRACNNFPKLVEALELLLDCQCVDAGLCVGCRSVAKNALAAAEGE